MGPAAKKILRALDRRANNIEVPVRTVAPTRSTASLGQSLVVDLSENRLYLYDALKVVRSYPVATAADGYVTPVGTWEIVDKRENPTWYNPALDTWGADLPAVIPPGPGNPLGTRALYLNAPGIRIHGTYSTDSIGTYASHGCVRMFLEDSEELYRARGRGDPGHRQAVTSDSDVRPPSPPRIPPAGARRPTVDRRTGPPGGTPRSERDGLWAPRPG